MEQQNKLPEGSYADYTRGVLIVPELGGVAFEVLGATSEEVAAVLDGSRGLLHEDMTLERYNQLVGKAMMLANPVDRDRGLVFAQTAVRKWEELTIRATDPDGEKVERKIKCSTEIENTRAVGFMLVYTSRADYEAEHGTGSRPLVLGTGEGIPNRWNRGRGNDERAGKTTR